MSDRQFLVGIDVGSVSVNVAVLDDDGQVVREKYIRHHGHPMATAASALKEVLAEFGQENIELIGATGTGGRIVCDIIGGAFVNEVVAQAKAAAALYPQVRTIIEIGGEDSKLIFLRPNAQGELEVGDFAMNTMCAAGTGSFLDQQATRLGLTIEEFGRLALKSEHPPRVAGRCSVFAKSDMIHLQQQATPVHDIVAGLCYALVRNFKSTVGSSAPLSPPVAFHGGVAANAGIVRAMRDVLELEGDDFIVPEHFAAMGAIGAALQAAATGAGRDVAWDRLDELAGYAAQRSARRLPPLKLEKSTVMEGEVHRPEVKPGERIPAYLGIDVGSISTNLVVIDEQRRVLAKRYLMTAGRPIEAVRQGLREIGEEIGDIVDIRGVCTTGSGRYLIADFVGADVVKNEITAQARGALHIDPTVDTIFEIGGQDSKFISLDNGHVVDFEMNKVCAAGTGSFLEEQAERLGISIKGQFADLAFRSQTPADLGERCTVFMETELTRQQQAGAPVEDLVAGLAYSIVYNYLNRVVGRKRVGNRIFFQGGTAFNRAVVAAFEQVTGKPITVPAHHEVTGAIGCALIAMENDHGQGSTFRGFDLADRKYTQESFECTDCPNRCEINVVHIEGERPLYYGSRCEKYDVDRRSRKRPDIPDLFRERERMLMGAYKPEGELPEDAPRVGIPRAHLFHELYPFWHALFTELGCRLVLSDPTNKAIIHEGAEQSLAETCFPCKVMLGHVLNLLEKDIDYIFLPSVINLRPLDPNMTDSFVCPYVQSAPYWLKAGIDFDAHGIQVLEPKIYLAYGLRHRVEALSHMARQLGASTARLRRALARAQEAQDRFEAAMSERGREILASLPDDAYAIVVIGRSYNSCDPGSNLEIPKKLRDMGVLAIPLDFLPIDTVRLRGDWFNMYWRYGQKILASAEIVADDDRLYPLYITNFGCGPDSFIMRFVQERLGDKPMLIIEIDEHSADAGMITRCEAFLDSIEQVRGRQFGGQKYFRPLTIEKGSHRTVLIPNMSGHAFALAAAFQACGMKAEVLPEPDEETLYWGRRHTTGKECFPAIVTTGDMVKRVKQPDFDRDRYAFFMGGSGGPCRFGQYNALQRLVLDELGYEDVPIYAPNQAASFYNDLGIVGRKFIRLAWRGVVAADLIEKCLLETRPHETQAGAAEHAYWQSLDDLCDVIRRGGEFEDFIACMERTRERFAAIAVDRQPKPIIGLVGEFYVRANRFSNQNIIAQIERLGGEVWMAPVYEWFLYRNFRRDMRARQRAQLRLLIKNKLTDAVMKKEEHRLVEVFDGFLRNCHEPPTDMVLWYAAPYMHHTFEGEAIMTVGKAVDFAQRGLSGIVAVMPFTCMPGTISHAILKRVRRDFDDIPFLNMVYDGFEQATALTRIEAFMHQAREYMRRKGLDRPRQPEHADAAAVAGE